jgi:hypothetical protein
MQKKGNAAQGNGGGGANWQPHEKHKPPLKAKPLLSKGRRERQLTNGAGYGACAHTATLVEQVPPNIHPALLERLPGRSILSQIAALRARQAPYGSIFWVLEQAIGRLEDEIRRRRS